MKPNFITKKNFLPGIFSKLSQVSKIEIKFETNNRNEKLLISKNNSKIILIGPTIPHSLRYFASSSGFLCIDARQRLEQKKIKR